MVEAGSIRDFLKDLSMRVVAALVVIFVFFALGYLRKTNLFGLGALLDSGTAFFAAAFGIIGAVWVLYLLYLFYIE
jgi:predicted outer membrane lipoprotein